MLPPAQHTLEEVLQPCTDFPSLSPSIQLSRWKDSISGRTAFHGATFPPPNHHRATPAASLRALGLGAQQDTTSLPWELPAQVSLNPESAAVPAAGSGGTGGTRSADPSPRRCSCSKLMVPTPKQDTESSSPAGTAVWDQPPADSSAATQSVREPLPAPGTEQRPEPHLTGKLGAKPDPRCKLRVLPG